MADLPPLDAALLDESMPGTPTSVQLREAQTAFEDTAEDLKHTMRALAASQQDLTAMQQDRDGLRARNAELEQAYTDARNEARVMRQTAQLYLTQRDNALHDLARADFELKRRVTVARQDAGACVRCGEPIVRSQAVEPQPGTTKGSYSHVECPDVKQ